jgi:aspartokinase/homoserine dehydrogenase 1
VITGFIASTEEGRRTTIGRNGSDFSAAIFASLFKAKCLTIWKDVDGIFTADPKRVRSAFVIETLSYNEALEFAYFGAKVLHPMTVAPLLKHQIPLRIKNSLNPTAEGTYISAVPKSSPYLIKGLTCIDNIALINIEGTGMIGVSGIAARVFQILHQAHISVILISQASSEQSICFAIPSGFADLAIKELTDNLQFEIDRDQIEAIHADRNCAILAVIGDNMVGTTGISGKVFDTLAKANINIRAISQGSSERNISAVIKHEDINRALQTVHAGFYLSPKTISIGLIGPGQIGGTLLNQIEATLDALQVKYQVNLCVRGIMNSKKMLLSHEAVDLALWSESLDKSNVSPNMDEFISHIKANDIPHAVIIDCTANNRISEKYINFIEQGIHVITPNKHANSGDLNYYKKLKNSVQQKKCHYLYEATVCAGLPIINTLQDLIKTGDEVDKVEGVVSGTLSFLFNELAKGRLFSEIIFEAKKLGFTEPDPREDLSGMDVARKFICLAREIGYDISFNDIKLHNLVPETLRSCSVDEFLAKLPEYDNEIADLVKQSKNKQEQLCYMGVIHPDGKIDVDIHSLPDTHAFSRLRGADNMLIFHTRRYHEQPLIIQGPGAGAEVTAAGIFADLLRLVSFIS